METIKDIWYAVIAEEKVKSVFEELSHAQEEAEDYAGGAKVERVRVTIDRIKTS